MSLFSFVIRLLGLILLVIEFGIKMCFEVDDYEISVVVCFRGLVGFVVLMVSVLNLG